MGYVLPIYIYIYIQFQTGFLFVLSILDIHSSSIHNVLLMICLPICSTQTGPILCCKPVLRSTVPLLCSTHMQVAEKHLIRALKRGGLNISSTKKLAPKFHILVAECVRQIQTKRRAALKATIAQVQIEEELR
jgi:hypothetical protein